MKKSKLQRKFVNQMRGMGDIPWPARRFRYPPTFGGVAVIGQCPRVVGEVNVRKPGRRNRLMRRTKPVQVVCGGEVVLVPLKGAHCVSCRDRGRQRRELQRAITRLQSVRVHSRGGEIKESRSLRDRLSNFGRRGSRGA